MTVPRKVMTLVELEVDAAANNSIVAAVLVLHQQSFQALER